MSPSAALLLSCLTYENGYEFHIPIAHDKSNSKYF